MNLNNAYSHVLTVDVERLGVTLHPEVGRDCTDAHGRAVVSLDQRERQTNDHEVGVVDAVLCPFALVADLAEDSHGAAEDREHDAEDTAGVGDRESIGGDGHGDGSPGGDGRGGEGAS